MSEGSCYCGRVRFAVELPARFVAHCHCANCRRAHGAGFVTWCGFEKRKLRVISGEDGLGRYTTDTGATRSFCTTCGTPLFYESPRWPDEIHVAFAHLDHAIDVLPAAHVYADRSPAWCPIHDDLPRYGGDTGVEPLRD